MFSRSFHLECELISLEQENQKRACAVDIQTFKGLLRTLDDPEDVKRIFGKNFVLAGASTDAAAAAVCFSHRHGAAVLATHQHRCCPTVLLFYRFFNEY